MDGDYQRALLNDLHLFISRYVIHPDRYPVASLYYPGTFLLVSIFCICGERVDLSVISVLIPLPAATFSALLPYRHAAGYIYVIVGMVRKQ
jgi:hypothetical protein